MGIAGRHWPAVFHCLRGNPYIIFWNWRSGTRQLGLDLPYSLAVFSFGQKQFYTLQKGR